MEKPIDPEIPLMILHHDEHLTFPGYDVMVGRGCVGQDEREPWAVRDLEAKADRDAYGRNPVKLSLYKKHEKLLFVAAIVWCAAFS